MRRSQLIAVTALATLSIVLVAVSLSVYIERPTLLRIAVSSGDIDDINLFAAASKLAKHQARGLRLKVVPAESAVQAAHALEVNEADVAVVRPDLAMPEKGETVVLLHKDVALLIAPGGGEIEKIADLAGKRVGLLGQRIGDQKLFEAALGQYDLTPDSLTIVPLKPEDVGGAVAAKTIDAFFAVDQVASPAMQAAVRAVAKGGEGPPVFLPIAEAAAIADRLPVYESVEVIKGSFGGLPPRPSEDIDTLGVTTRLVASADLSDSVVASLTRLLLSDRIALTELAPIARRMTAPPTDKSAALPVHPGTAAYIDDDEETFLDKYSDFIYIGAMVLGVCASGLTAVVGRFGRSNTIPVEVTVGRLLAILKQVRAAPTLAALEEFEVEADAIVAEALDDACLRGLDERKAATLTMAVEQVRSAIRSRGKTMRAGQPLAANDDPATFEPVLLTLKGVGERGKDL